MRRGTMIFDAIEFAAAAHRGQFRKLTPVPYITHPIAVARILLEAGCAEHLAVAALLHDTIEDTAVTEAEIRLRFGGRVADLVVAASEPDHATEWEDRKRHTIDFLRDEAGAEALLVTLADKLDNIISIHDGLLASGESSWSRFKRGREAQRWYYTSLRDIYLQRLTTEPGKSLAARFDSYVSSVFGS